MKACPMWPSTLGLSSQEKSRLRGNSLVSQTSRREVQNEVLVSSPWSLMTRHIRMAQSCTAESSDWIFRNISLLWEWSRTIAGFPERCWCQLPVSVICIMPLLIYFNFWLPFKWSGSSTWQPLKIHSNYVLYSDLFYYFLFIFSECFFSRSMQKSLFLQWCCKPKRKAAVSGSCNTYTENQAQHSFLQNVFQYFLSAPAVTSLSLCPLLDKKNNHVVLVAKYN